MTVKPLPKWAMKKYSMLWTRFQNNEFEYSEATDFLKEKNPNFVSVLLINPQKNGWARIKPGYANRKKRIYLLKRPSEAVEGIDLITDKEKN
jgi:hypothetical protein